MQVLVKEFMSSESSAEEDLDDESGSRAVIAVKPLPWRGAKATRMMKRLDGRAESKKSKQAKQQTLPRVIGLNSQRPKPVSFPDDFWGFALN